MTRPVSVTDATSVLVVTGVLAGIALAVLLTYRFLVRKVEADPYDEPWFA